jgi:hypothetical protein
MVLWKNCAILTLGVFIGSAIFSAIRTEYYLYNKIQTEVGPQMFVAVSPILAVPIVIIALVIHIPLRNYFKFNVSWKWFLSGISYASILLGLISPWMLIIPIVLNPFSLKLISKVN